MTSPHTVRAGSPNSENWRAMFSRAVLLYTSIRHLCAAVHHIMGSSPGAGADGHMLATLIAYAGVAAYLSIPLGFELYAASTHAVREASALWETSAWLRRRTMHKIHKAAITYIDMKSRRIRGKTYL